MRADAANRALGPSVLPFRLEGQDVKSIRGVIPRCQPNTAKDDAIEQPQPWAVEHDTGHEDQAAILLGEDVQRRDRQPCGR